MRAKEKEHGNCTAGQLCPIALIIRRTNGSPPPAATSRCMPITRTFMTTNLTDADTTATESAPLSCPHCRGNSRGCHAPHAPTSTGRQSLPWLF